mmetsp:Transcript_56772/g.166144  ORF Transcript_56772/g.166144 Transcript_56772/m.166144 type:complete len:185 (-) Transcript_56772:20-574(-)
MANVHPCVLLVLLIRAHGHAVFRRRGGSLHSPLAGEHALLQSALALSPPGAAGNEDPCQQEASLATAVPHNKPRFIRFVDKDLQDGLVSGTVRVGHAYCEDDIIWYSLYWARNGTLVEPPIITLGKTGKDITFDINEKVRHDVNQLMAVTVNHRGAMAEGPVKDLFDHVEPPLSRIFGNILRGG